MRGDGQKFIGIFDGVIIGLFVGHGHENFRHRTTVIGMGRGAGCDLARKVARSNGVGRRTAQSLAIVLAFDAAFGQRQAAGAHGAIFTAGPLDSDVAGFHFRSPIENGLHSQFLGPPDHLLGGDINGRANRIGNFRGFLRFYRFFIRCFCHTRFLLIILNKIKF